MTIENKVFCDLHAHSTASDGQYTPTQLVQLAYQKEINILAITDHDTIGGLDEGVAAGERLGVTVIRGIEFSAKEYPTFHILGYNFFDGPEAESLKQICDAMKKEREQRKYKIIDFLRDNDVDIPLSEVEEIAGGVVGKPHFAQILVRHGYADSVRDAFNKYLNTPEYRKRVKREKPSARKCIEAIKQAGGKVSLAHPYQISVDNASLEGIVGKLKGYGLDAIELMYPKYTQEMRDFYQYLIKKYDLHATGGSDYHGEKVKPDTHLMQYQLDYSWIFE